MQPLQRSPYSAAVAGPLSHCLHQPARLLGPDTPCKPQTALPFATAFTPEFIPALHTPTFTASPHTPASPRNRAAVPGQEAAALLRPLQLQHVQELMGGPLGAEQALRRYTAAEGR